MLSRQNRRSYIVALTALGGVLGFIYAKHLIALSTAGMIAKKGWICGVGLQIPIYLWTPAGAFIGLNMGILTWTLSARIIQNLRGKST